MRSIEVPPSKSQTMRALVFAALAEGESTITNYLPSPDTEAMLAALGLLGVQIVRTPGKVVVRGDLKPASDVIDCGNSGQVLRFLGGLSALLPSYTVLTGDHSIRHQRPVAPLLSGLTQLGAFAVSTKGDDLAPILIRGPLQGGVARISGEDSQPVSALLMACAFAPARSEILVENPGETPWVNLTLSWLDRFAIGYTREGFDRFTLEGGARIRPFAYQVPADFSSLLYPVSFAILAGKALEIRGLNLEEPQGDKEVLFLLQKMGAHLQIEADKVVVLPGSELKGCTVDVNAFIDALPLLAVLGCFAKGVTTLTGGAIARRKESDRIAVIVQELRKMGATIEEREDGLVVERSTLKGAQLKAHADHRIALSLTLAATFASGASVIEGKECARKSYPGFYEHYLDWI